jgi:hypothetical protein
MYNVKQDESDLVGERFKFKDYMISKRLDPGSVFGAYSLIKSFSYPNGAQREKVNVYSAVNSQSNCTNPCNDCKLTEIRCGFNWFRE